MEMIAEVRPGTGQFWGYSWSRYDICGLIGFLLYVMNYCLITFRFLSTQGIAFFFINIGAASLVLFSLMHDFNLASALIQSFWIILGSVAVLIRVREKIRHPNTPTLLDALHPSTMTKDSS